MVEVVDVVDVVDVLGGADMFEPFQRDVDPGLIGLFSLTSDFCRHPPFIAAYKDHSTDDNSSAFSASSYQALVI